MTTKDQTRDEKLQYDINRKTVKASGKIDTYEYLTGKEILPSNQQKIIEQAKCTYYSLVKASEKQTKAIENQDRKQIDALGSLKPKVLKPKESKPKDGTPVEYDNYFLNGLSEI